MNYELRAVIKWSGDRVTRAIMNYELWIKSGDQVKWWSSDKSNYELWVMNYELRAGKSNYELWVMNYERWKSDEVIKSGNQVKKWSSEEERAVMS